MSDELSREQVIDRLIKLRTGRLQEQYDLHDELVANDATLRTRLEEQTNTLTQRDAFVKEQRSRIDDLEQRLAEQTARAEAAEEKGKRLCVAHGNLLIEHHDSTARLAAAERAFRALDATLEARRNQTVGADLYNNVLDMFSHMRSERDEARQHLSQAEAGRKILTVESGAYDEYRIEYWYAPNNFSWACVAEQIKKRLHTMNPKRKNYNSADDLMRISLMAAGCKPVESHYSINIDDLRIDWDARDHITYESAHSFIAHLKEKRP